MATIIPDDAIFIGGNDIPKVFKIYIKRFDGDWELYTQSEQIINFWEIEKIKISNDTDFNLKKGWTFTHQNNNGDWVPSYFRTVLMKNYITTPAYLIPPTAIPGISEHLYLLPLPAKPHSSKTVEFKDFFRWDLDWYIENKPAGDFYLTFAPAYYKCDGSLDNYVYACYPCICNQLEQINNILGGN